VGQEFGLERRLVLGADRHEVVQLIVVSRRDPSSDRLKALALARANQASHIEWAHAPAGRMAKRFEEGFEPGLEFVLPRH
jgi:hypothetical protein